MSARVCELHLTIVVCLVVGCSGNSPVPGSVRSEQRNAAKELSRMHASMGVDRSGSIVDVGFYYDNEDSTNPVVSNDDLRSISEIPTLRSLDLSATDVTDTGLMYLAGIPTLNAVILPSTISDAGLKNVASCSGLETIAFLMASRVGDQGVANLAPLENLKSLQLDAAEIDGSTLLNLSCKSRLERLYLAGTQLTDSNLSNLASFPRLTHLDVSFTEVSGKGVSKVVTALKQLVWLNVRGTGVSQSSIDELLATHTELQIISKP